MYLFWDNSNIHFSGVTHACPKMEPEANPLLYRTHFHNLIELVCSGRRLEKVFVSSQSPSPADSLWAQMRTLGVSLSVLPQAAAGQGDTFDNCLQSMMLRTLLDETPSVMAVLTGDGAGSQLGKGFLADLRRARKWGWQIEVFAWERTCNRHLKEFAQAEGRFIALEDYYYHISFLKGARPAKPLPRYKEG